ncbi:MAG: FtsQ-type POTRA domain-containing protein [Cyanobacteria bacterium SIG30]|nr:FtsQ-type POTRA domain-containing protein [Cyanobacteria bacterium SIG30]
MQKGEQHFSQEYYKRRLKANKIIRRIVAKRRQLKFLRVLCRLGVILAIILLMIFVLKLPNWHVDHNLLIKGDKSVLKIIGNNITPTYKIVDMIRQTNVPDIEIFRYNTKEMEENIKQLEPIKNVHIRRFWFPARFVVFVEEQNPVFSLAPNLESEAVSAVTKDGMLIGRDYMPLKQSIKTIKVLSNDIYGKWDKERVEKLLLAVKLIEAYSDSKVQYIDFRKIEDVYFCVDDILLRVGELDLTFNKRLEAIVSILPEIGEFRNKIEYIDLRWKSKYLKLKNTEPKLYENSDQQ